MERVNGGDTGQAKPGVTNFFDRLLERVAALLGFDPPDLSVLFGVKPTDPLTTFLVTITLKATIADA